MDRSATIASLLSTAASSDHPSRRLRAVARLREELEAMETEVAADAVRGGMSWRQIGTSLGISKQAAHRRHSQGVSLLEQTRRKHLDGGVAFSPNVRQAVQSARQEAARLGRREVEVELLLLGLIRSRDPDTAAVLARAGISTTAAEVALTRAGADDGASRGAPPSAATTGAVGLSARSRWAIRRALAEAAARGQETVSGLELFRALADDRTGRAVHLLAGLQGRGDALDVALDQASHARR